MSIYLSIYLSISLSLSLSLSLLLSPTPSFSNRKLSLPPRPPVDVYVFQIGKYDMNFRPKKQFLFLCMFLTDTYVGRPMEIVKNSEINISIRNVPPNIPKLLNYFYLRDISIRTSSLTSSHILKCQVRPIISATWSHLTKSFGIVFHHSGSK